MNGFNELELAGWLGPVLGKGLVLLALAFGFSTLMGKRRCAAGKRLFWSMTMAGLVVIAGLEGLLPKWQWPRKPASPAEKNPPPAIVLPNPETPAAADLPFETASLPREPAEPPASFLPTAPEKIAATPLDRRANPVESNPEPVSPAPAPSFDWSRLTRHVSLGALSSLLASLWFAGTGVLALRLLFSRLALRKLERTAEAADASWSRLADSLSSRLGLKKTPRLLISPKVTVPMAWGILRPRILLSETANDLDDGARRYLLRHELCHIASRDARSLLVAQLAAILHWPNPLVWLAVRHLRLAQERACDDASVETDGVPADYADLLVDIARRGRESLWSPASVALTMAAGSSLKKRINALLDPDMKRNPPKKIEVVLTLILLAGVSLGLAGLAWSTDDEKPTVIAPPATVPESFKPENITPIPEPDISTPGPNPYPTPEPDIPGTTTSSPGPPAAPEALRANPQRDALLLKLARALPDDVDVETAREIADDLVTSHPKLAEKLAGGSATVKATVLRDSTTGASALTVTISDKTDRRRISFSKVYRSNPTEFSFDPVDPFDRHAPIDDVVAAGIPQKPSAPRGAIPPIGANPLIGRVPSSLEDEIQPAVPGAMTLEEILDAVMLDLIDFEDTPLPNILEWLEDESQQAGGGGDSFHPDRLPGAGINILLLREARNRIQDPASHFTAQLETAIKEGAKWLAQARDDFRAHLEVNASGKEGIESEIHSMELEQSRRTYEAALQNLDELRKQAAALHPRPPGGGGDDFMITLRLRNVPLRDALHYVTQLAGLTFEVQPHAVVIGTPEEIEALAVRRLTRRPDTTVASPFLEPDPGAPLPLATDPGAE